MIGTFVKESMEQENIYAKEPTASFYVNPMKMILSEELLMAIAKGRWYLRKEDLSFLFVRHSPAA